MNRFIILIFLLVILIFSGCSTQKELPGASCTADANCLSGTCINRVCAKSDIGESCRNTLGCEIGICKSQVCVLSDHKGACNLDSDCGTGLSCYQNQCFTKNDALCELNKSLQPHSIIIFLIGLVMMVLGGAGFGGRNDQMAFSHQGSGASLAIIGLLPMGIVLTILSIFIWLFHFC